MFCSDVEIITKGGKRKGRGGRKKEREWEGGRKKGTEEERGRKRG